jgi:hypothetical protein
MSAILAAQKAEIRGIMVRQAWAKKAHETPTQEKKLEMVTCISHPSYCEKHK